MCASQDSEAGDPRATAYSVCGTSRSKGCSSQPHEFICVCACVCVCVCVCHAACFEGAHIIHAAIASLSFVIFVFLDCVMQIGELELNPLSRSLTAVAHTR